MKKLFAIICITFLALQTTNTWAWGTTGHRVIAEIAERNLSKKAKKQLKSIIGDQKLAYWANWPDFIKSDSAWKFADTWHYVNVSSDLNREEFDAQLAASSDDNLYKRTLILIEELKDKNLSVEEKQQKLYFLIHILGDAHQPLHLGRPEDLGGNRVKLEWFRKPTNLHSLWDSALVDFDKYSYTEYADVVDVYGKKHNEVLANGTIEDWIFDSYNLANKIYADTPGESALSYKYHYQFKDAVEAQLLKGGVRLAAVLNDIFK